jgi:hypothetical protein
MGKSFVEKKGECLSKKKKKKNEFLTASSTFFVFCFNFTKARGFLPALFGLWVFFFLFACGEQQQRVTKEFNFVVGAKKHVRSIKPTKK